MVGADHAGVEVFSASPDVAPPRTESRAVAALLFG